MSNKPADALQKFSDYMPLGKTDIVVSVLGLGTWQWGDRMFWGYGKTHNDQDIQDAFHASLEAGVNFFDTAEVYGLGRSEQYLGRFVRALPDSMRKNLVIATKFFPMPYRLWKFQFRWALRGSLRRLGLKQVDLYQIHSPYAIRSIEIWVDGLADALEAGLIKAAGVSNYDVDQTRRAWTVLKSRGFPLASNQVEYSLLNRNVEKQGLLALCQELAITLIAYSPLAKGILTGKYNPENPPPGFRRGIYDQTLLRKTQPLIQLMREIGEGHGGKTPAQVALNWTICKGAVAIPGAKNKRQAIENAQALGWRLTPEEVAALDKASDEVLA